MNAVIIRALLYTLLAALPPFVSFFAGLMDEMEKGSVVVVTWVEWTWLSLTAAYQAGVALRAYADGSNERRKQEKAAE